MEGAHSLVTELRPNITHIDVLQRLMGLEITDLDDKRMGAVILAPDIQLRHHNSMVGGAAQRPNPPLGRSQGRRVNGEGLIFGVIRRARLQASDIGPVAQFGLGVAPENLILLRALKEDLVLFGGPLFAEGDLEENSALVTAAS